MNFEFYWLVGINILFGTAGMGSLLWIELKANHFYCDVLRCDYRHRRWVFCYDGKPKCLLKAFLKILRWNRVGLFAFFIIYPAYCFLFVLFAGEVLKRVEWISFVPAALWCGGSLFLRCGKVIRRTIKQNQKETIEEMYPLKGEDVK